MFQFKQFRIEQDRCAMKVGTDSILLGAWTSSPKGGKILDIGSGTGILALMMAQKDQEASVVAVEVDEAAASQCRENIDNSPWGNRIEVFRTAIQDFKPEYMYDLIICNPPYFPEDLAATTPQRMLARQGENLDTATLISQFDRLISEKGRCALVMPYSSWDDLEEILADNNLYLQKICRVKASPRKAPSRMLLLLGRENKPLEEESIVIQTGGANEYSEAYLELTQDFYLNLR